MAAGFHHLLPPLHEGHKVPPVPKRGTWHRLGDGALQVIANGLNTATSTGSATGIVSVPDVWAQVTLFNNALGVETHLGHRQAVAEWRGLLACFALAAYHVPDLTTELVPVGRGGSAWAVLAGRLPPHCALLDGRALDEVALVRAGPELIALAQPLTLLAPSRSLRDGTSRPPIPWMAEGRLLDPLGGAGLPLNERRVLADMLGQLARDLEAELRRGRDVGMLLGLARSFLRDASAGIADLSATQFDVLTASVSLPASAAFRALLPRKRVAAGAGGTVSDCLLQVRPGLDGGKLRGIILVDHGLPQQLGRSPGEVQVWGHHSMRMLADRPEDIAAVRTDAQGNGYLLVETADLFLPQLYRANMEGGGSLEQHGPTTRGHLLPLSPLLAAVFDRAGLAQACQMAPGGAGGTLVALRLPMADGSTVTVSRHYPAADGAEPPVSLSLWPDFRADWWRLHMGWSSASTGFQFVVAGFVSLQGLAGALRSAADGHGAVGAARTLLGGATPGRTTWFSRSASVVRALYGLPGAAEIAVMEDRRGAPHPAGLLLLRDPEPVATSGGTARIGIDFGTTNTAIYLQVGAGEPEPLQIEARQLLAYGIVEQARDELDADFLPVEPVPTPFQTILRDRLAPAGDGRREPFRDTLIYFARRRGRAVEEAMKPDLFANLKWGDDQASRERVELFLTEAVVLAAAEAARRGVQPGALAFRFSYPEAFRPQQADSFKGAARNAVKAAASLIAIPGGVSPAAPRFQTESVAAAQYFIHKLRTPATEGIITFDIGGQTTDVAVVQSRAVSGAERLVWRGSFQLAGRHLLIDHLRQRPAVLDQLASNRAELGKLVRALAATDKSAPDRRILATELVVNSPDFADAFADVFPTLAGMGTADQLRATALAGLAGLFDYVGRTVRHLAETGALDARPNSPVYLCLGGRASLLFHTLLNGEDGAAKILAFFTGATGGSMPYAQLRFSEAPKQEVAYGLVRDDNALLGGVPTAPLLGEAVRSGGTITPASALVGDLDFRQMWRIENPVEFRRFAALLPGLGIPALPEAELGVMTGQATSEIANALRVAQREQPLDQADGDASLLEPPFIVLLRLLVARLAGTRLRA